MRSTMHRRDYYPFRTTQPLDSLLLVGVHLRRSSTSAGDLVLSMTPLIPAQSTLRSLFVRDREFDLLDPELALP